MAIARMPDAFFDLAAHHLPPEADRRPCRWAARPLGAPDVRTLSSGWRLPGASLPEDLLANAEGVATIIRITGGNFRLLDRLLTQVARILTLNGLERVTRAVLVIDTA